MKEGQSRNLNMLRGRRLKRTNDFVDEGLTGAMLQFKLSTLDEFTKCLVSVSLSYALFHVISCIQCICHSATFRPAILTVLQLPQCALTGQSS